MTQLQKVDLPDLERRIGIEFPSYKRVSKEESGLMKLINFILRCLTFGQMKTFMTDFTTTLGYTVYTPLGWGMRSETSRAVTLRHERVHMRQRQKYGFFIFSFLYLFVLPFGRAFYRTKFEKEAYEESMLASAEYYGEDILEHKSTRDHYVKQFTSSSYLWMWTNEKDIVAWYDTTHARISRRLNPNIS